MALNVTSKLFQEVAPDLFEEFREKKTTLLTFSLLLLWRYQKSCMSPRIASNSREQRNEGEHGRVG